MTIRKVLLVVLLVTVFPLMDWGSAARACEGPPRPFCPRTAWVAKFPLTVAVLPPGGGPITAPLVLLPYVAWNNADPDCAQPISHSLTVTLTCVSVGGGAPIVVGPITVPMVDPAPTVPGVQPLAAGNPFLLPIPAGVLPPAGVPYLCDVAAAYTVTFAGGIGAGPIIGVGDSVLCVVPPSPVDDTKPRLNMELLVPPGEDAWHACRKGDQACSFYLIENCDPDESVTLTFKTSTNQIARTPGGTDPDKTFYAVSNPTPGTDGFPQAFPKDMTSALLPLPDPSAVDPLEISCDFTLAPGDVKILKVYIRSNGMCGNGSCCEVIATVEGKWSDGDDALACAGTALIVDDQAAKTPLAEVTDTIKCSPNTDTRWTSVVMDGDPHKSTHAFGNEESEVGQRWTAISGSNLNSPWPDMSVDNGRFDNPPGNFMYAVRYFRQDQNFQEHVNNMSVIAQRVAQAGIVSVDVEIPVIYSTTGPSAVSVSYDVPTGRLIASTVLALGGFTTLFDGDLSALTLPAGWAFDKDSCRRIQSPGIDPALRYLCVTPEEKSGLVTGPLDPVKTRVYDPRDGTDLPWSATSNHPAVVLTKGSGGAGEMIEEMYDPSKIAVFPETTIAWITVTNPGTINPRVFKPVALRSLQALAANLLLKSLLVKLNFKKDNKDLVKLVGYLSLGEGFDPTGQEVTVDVCDILFLFLLTSKGKPEVKDSMQKFSMKYKKKLDLWQFSFLAKRQSLFGLLLVKGFLNALIKKPGTDLTLPVSVLIGGKTYMTDASVNYRSKEDKNGKGKLNKDE